MTPIVECVPNFSAGKNSTIVEAIAASISATNGIHMAGIQMDNDHNRSVITFMGSPEDVSLGAFEACRTATSLIDIREHRGVHPRIGATDVIPFIPISDYTTSECIELARACGRKIAQHLEIPVIFYGSAAMNPKRRELSSVRREAFAGILGNLRLNTDESPDTGPNYLHLTAGAVAVGVRDILVAYNINLNTPDIRIARMIAHEIREINHGLPAVRALGLFLSERNLAQVSINLTNYRKTNMHQVFRTVKKLAEEQTIKILESELVGLAPLAALGGANPEDLLMDSFDPKQFLEYHTGRLADKCSKD